MKRLINKKVFALLSAIILGCFISACDADNESSSEKLPPRITVNFLGHNLLDLRVDNNNLVACNLPGVHNSVCSISYKNSSVQHKTYNLDSEDAGYDYTNDYTSGYTDDYADDDSSAGSSTISGSGITDMLNNINPDELPTDQLSNGGSSYSASVPVYSSFDAGISNTTISGNGGAISFFGSAGYGTGIQGLASSQSAGVGANCDVVGGMCNFVASLAQAIPPSMTEGATISYDYCINIVNEGMAQNAEAAALITGNPYICQLISYLQCMVPSISEIISEVTNSVENGNIDQDAITQKMEAAAKACGIATFGSSITSGESSGN